MTGYLVLYKRVKKYRTYIHEKESISMMRICFLEDSEFFYLVEEKLNHIKHHNVKIVTNSPAEMILIDEETIEASDLFKILPLYEKEKVILFTDNHRDVDVLTLLSLGIDSILYKRNVELEQLPEVLEQIQHDEFFLPSEMTGTLIGRIVQLKNSEHDRFLHQVQDDEIRLTLKQAEIAALMKHGHSNKEIANLLGVSEGSVKVHVSQIYSKFGTSDRTLVIKRLLERI